MLEALNGADALMIVTEWKEFRSPSFDEIRARLTSPVIFDGRNLYEPSVPARHGIEYHSVGRPVTRGDDDAAARTAPAIGPGTPS